MTNDALATGINWESSEPSLTSEGTVATVDPFAAWQYFAVDPVSYSGYPLCELPHITQIWSGNTPFPIHILSDGDLDTCYSPPTMMAAASLRLTTARLNPDGEKSMLVKVHGDNIICLASQGDSNLYVMNAVKTDVVNGKYRYRMCTLYAGYTWRGKQLCLYECNCGLTDPCKEVYMKTDLDPSITICEFSVL